MELLVKLYQDKSPRIGVVYPSEFQAGKAFEEILKKHGHENFKAFLELKRHHLQLTLVPLNGGANVVYKELSFKPEQIKNLQAFIKPGTEMHFVHVFKKGSEPFIAKVEIGPIIAAYCHMACHMISQKRQNPFIAMVSDDLRGPEPD